ncbi:MAG: hypothetical protein AB1414_15420 [bacterium]
MEMSCGWLGQRAENREQRAESREIASNVLIAPAYKIFWSKDNKKIGFNIREENKRKFGIFDFERNEKKQIEIFTPGISWLPDNENFIYESLKPHHLVRGSFEKDKSFLYNLKENKSIEIKEFDELGLSGGQWSPKELVYLVFKDVPNLIYFSPDYKIIKIETIGNEGPLGWPKWREDGKLLLFGKSKAILYNVAKHNIAWKQDYNFSPAITDDFKWSYFLHNGKLTQQWSVYRISAPKQIAEMLRRD